MDLASHWAGDDGAPVVCLSAFTTDRAVTAQAFDPALAAAGATCWPAGRTAATSPRMSDVLTGSSPGDEEYQERLRADGFRLPDEDAAARFDGPVTMVAGRQDRTVGYADQFRRLACYPAGTFAVLDRAGHYLPFEQPEALAALIAEWRARCPASL